MGILGAFFRRTRKGRSKVGDTQLSQRSTPQSPPESSQEQGGSAGSTKEFSRVPRAPAWLVVGGGGDSGRIVEIQGDRLTIGRAPSNDFQLDESTVDPQHALIRATQGRFLLHDLASTGGTWVNGNPVRGQFLSEGSRIFIGSSELLFTRSSGASVILVRSGPSVGRSFTLGDADLVIGRDPGDDGAQLDDAEVSRRHALVRPTPHDPLIYDLGSVNGTLVDGTDLAGTFLHHGDVIKLGEAELQFALQGSG